MIDIIKFNYIDIIYMTYTTKAPTNPCNSILNPFYPVNRLEGYKLRYAKANQTYEAPFRIHDGHLQQLAPSTVGVNQPNDYLSCAPSYTSTIDINKNDGSTKWGCDNPPPDLWWTKYNKAMFTKRTK